MFYIYIAIFVVNLIFGFFRSRSKIVVTISLFFTWLFLWGRTSGADYGAYFQEYNTTKTIDTGQALYDFLIVNFNRMGLSYHAFLAIMMGICMMIVIISLRTYIDNPHLILAFYYIYALPMDMIQVGNTFALTFLIACISAVVKRKYWLAFAFAIISTLIHSAFIFFVPFVFLLFNREEIAPVARRIIVGFAVVASGITFFAGNNVTWLYEPISKFMFTDDERLTLYTSTTTRLGFIIFIGLHLLYLFGAWYSKSLADYQGSTGVVENESLYLQSNSLVRFQRIIYNLVLYCVLLYPFMMSNSNFTRMIRDCSILCFVSFTNKYELSEDVEKSNSIIIFAFIIGIWFYFIRGDFSEYLRAMFDGMSFTF